MFTHLLRVIRSTIWQSFNLNASFLCVLQTRTIFHVLFTKIRSANRINFKLSQIRYFIMLSQSWKFQLKRLTTVVFISWSVFFESGSRGPCEDDVINLLSLIPSVVHFVESSCFTHTLHLKAILGSDDLTIFKCFRVISSLKKLSNLRFCSIFIINKKEPQSCQFPLTDETLSLSFWRHEQDKWLFQFSKFSSGSYASL